MDIIQKRGVKNGQGNSASDYRDIVAAAGSWQYGNDAFANDISDEAREEDLRFGVPREPLDFERTKVDLGDKGSFSVHKGALHRALGIPEGQKIPASKLEPHSGDSSHLKHMKASAKGFKAMSH